LKPKTGNPRQPEYILEYRAGKKKNAEIYAGVKKDFHFGIKQVIKILQMTSRRYFVHSMTDKPQNISI